MTKPFFTALFVALVAGCSMVQTAPQTPAQTAYAAKGAYVAVVDATTSMVKQDLISPDRAETIQGYLAEVRPKLDAAIATVQQGESLSGSQIQQVGTINAALQDILKELADE